MKQCVLAYFLNQDQTFGMIDYAKCFEGHVYLHLYEFLQMNDLNIQKFLNESIRIAKDDSLHSLLFEGCAELRENDYISIPRILFEKEGISHLFSTEGESTIHYFCGYSKLRIF